MNIGCILGFHNYRFKHIYEYNDDNPLLVKSYVFDAKCEKCGKVIKENIFP